VKCDDPKGEEKVQQEEPKGQRISLPRLIWFYCSIFMGTVFDAGCVLSSSRGLGCEM
jgi:hypothetical protein